MMKLWDSVKAGYLRAIEPAADYLVRHRVNPNVITTIGTACTLSAAVIYAFGHISIGGWVLGLTAIFDVLDGTVARRTGQESTFGAFYDSSLDRISDGAVLAGLTVFYATDSPRHSVAMWSSASRRSSEPSSRPTRARAPRRWGSTRRSA